MSGRFGENEPATASKEGNHKARQPRNFIRPSVLISIMSRRKLDSAERANLLGQISDKIGYLRKDLSGDAAALRRGVENRILALSHNNDEVGECIVSFSGTAGGETVTIEPGEAGSAQSGDKMARIVHGCVEMARSDLAFLERIEKEIRDGATIPEKDLGILEEILGKNTYWRAIRLL